MSGGFNKYRCKYFLSYNCPNWVFMNGHACGSCLVSLIPTEVCVPKAFQGTLQYIIMEAVPNATAGSYWTLRQKVLDPRTQMSQININQITTSDTPRPVMTTTGIPMQVRY
ncbi:uncharacterized protein PODANS_6_5020 [Podospora anserina S mat+]|uniref:Podospora anserina S mat+ genomic DNA chromosome 6, supercontig 2 n=1 Tax=Podospora anserina (strain S / ATCC MYA-4624 / DSM 980 / FGSC 10383) TaxID=515849 RepID=B2B1Z9_PODAN|nr:uncharacterized protein PODANS_6_5020 [Podospora anserina S mat+]CAP71134.1 unnamed protein product [Podospora anserina S mat+]CDP30532.1 Putative protein of unknown function [Podospora anserina S mat+]